MKRLIILIVLFFYVSPAWSLDSHGPAWKIEDGVVSPGVSATSLNFTGYSTAGLTVTEIDPVAMPVLANVSSQLNSLETSFTNFTGNVDAKTLNGLPDTSFTLLSTFSAYTSTVVGVDFGNITSQMNITFDAVKNMFINASTTHHTSTEGVIDIDLVPDAPSTRGTQVTINANGQNDTMAHNITYKADGMTATDSGMAIEVNVDPGSSTGGEVEGLRVTRTGVTGVDVNAIHVGTRVTPLKHESGSPQVTTAAFLNNSGAFVDAVAAFQTTTGILNYTLYPNQDDYIYVGHASLFSDIEVLLDTAASSSKTLVFEYSLGGSSWQIFGPNDATNGLTTDGAWSWDALSGWATDTVNGVAGKYWIRIQGSGAVITDAIEKSVSIIIPTLYSWGSGGDISAYDIMLEGTFGSGPALDVSGAGTRCFFYPKKAAFRCGYVSGTRWDDSGVGAYSDSTGFNNQGAGAYSDTAGQSNIASNTGTTSRGIENISSGIAGSTDGKGNTASGNYGRAQNFETTASGTAATSIGWSTIASALASSAGGKFGISDAEMAFTHGEYLRIGSGGIRSVMFGGYADFTERDANILNDPDTFKLANMDLIVDGFIDGIKTRGYLYDDQEGIGTPFNLTTSFQTYTSFTASASSSNVTATANAGTITLDSGRPGQFTVSVDAAVTGVGSPELVYGVFRNDTTELLTFERPIGGVHHHPPTMANLSSNATYNTYSSLENLFYADGTEVWIDEASSGADPLIYDLTFNSTVLYPTIVEFINVLYDGSAHAIEALMWNYNTATWVDMRTETNDFPNAGGSDAFRYYNREFAVPEPISEYVDTATREAMVRVHHTSTGSPGDEFKIDKIQLHDEHSTSALSFRHEVTLAVGDTLSLKIKSNLELPVYVKNLHLHMGKESN